MKNDRKSKEKIDKRDKEIKFCEEKLERWDRMKQGDTNALIEIMIERGMAKKEDFEERFPEA